MATTIKLKNSVTTTNTPTSLAQGEVAINITDKKVWVGNAATTPIQLLGAGSSASFGALTCTSLTNSGLTSGRVTYATTAGLLTDSAGLTFDGTNFATTGTATATRFIPSGSTVATNGMYLPAANSIGISTNSTNAIYIDSSQNVGIGVSSPGQKLDVSTTGDIQLRLGNAATGAQFTYDIGRVASTGLLQFYGNQSGATGYIFSGVNGERMRIDSSGNVGIGETSIAGTANYTQLVIRGTSGAELSLKGGSTQYGYVYVDNGGFRIINPQSGSASGTLQFHTSNTERMRITSGGSLLIGSTSNNANLWVEKSDDGNTFGARNTFATYSATVGFFGANRNTTNNSFYYIDCYNYGSSTYRFRVADSGNATNTNGSYGTISDAKLKENIVDATPKLDKVNQLKVRNFNLIGDDLKQIGFVAQEFEQVFPSMVEESADKDKDGNDLGTTTKTIKTTVLIPILVKAIQEQQAMIEELKQEVAKLKGV